jgi:hypothetical protein
LIAFRVNLFTTIASGTRYLRSVTSPKEASMKRFHLTTIAICTTIIAGAFGLAMHAQAENARPDYAAPLDMTSTYAEPDVMVTGGPAMAARETSGAAASDETRRVGAATSPEAPAKAADALPDDFYTLGP